MIFGILFDIIVLGNPILTAILLTKLFLKLENKRHKAFILASEIIMLIGQTLTIYFVYLAPQ